VKNAILTEKTHTSHFNYVGDSILGNHVHLGGGSVLANLRFDERKVMIKISTGTYLTDLRKVGAFIGNEARVGCNSVLQPGTVLARRSCVMSAMAYGGYLEANHMAILRDRGIAIVPRKFYT
jgi:bifunctional N-acetylglucosamine-1-phosphate-uridyltransferase/glucosamine-1-phosphate-acetyltransferase GlmU-like protein